MSALLVRTRAFLPGRWRGQLVLSFRRTAWFSDGSDSLVGLMQAGISPSPCGLELTGPLPNLEPGTVLENTGERWLLSGTITLENVDSAPDATAHLEVGLDDLVPTVGWVHQWQKWFDERLPHDAEGQWLSSLTLGPGHDWEALIGRGSGSTPLGDDYLAGWFAARRRRGLWSGHEQNRLQRALYRTTRLSRHYLSHLIEGRVESALRNCLAEKVLHEANSASTRAIAEHGDLSGRATLVGLYAGLVGGY